MKRLLLVAAWSTLACITTRAQDATGVHFPGLFQVFEPAAIASSDSAGVAVDWADLVLIRTDGITGALVHVEPARSCEPLTNPGEVAGRIALITNGECQFGLKALHAQQAGAIGFVIYNNDPEGPRGPNGLVNMSPGSFGQQVTIGGVYVSYVSSRPVLAALAQGGVQVRLFDKRPPPGPPAPPAAPALLNPVDGRTGLPVRPTMQWTAMASATSYRLEIARTPAFTTLDYVAEGPYAVHVVAEPLLPFTTYHWRVRAAGAAGQSAFSQTRTFTTGAPPPAPPALTSPPDGATGVPRTPELAWQTAPGAVAYDVQLSRSPTFEPVAYQVSLLTGTAHLVAEPLLPATLYYWRVRARGPGGAVDVGPWSDARTFTTIVVPPPAAPVLVSPANGAQGVSSSPLLEWQAVPEAHSYQVAISTDPSFATVVYIAGGLTGTSHQASLALAGETTYYWRVRATGTGGHGPWAEAWSFRTALSPPAAPALQWPSNGTSGVLPRPQVGWLPLPEVTSYEIQVSRDLGFAWLDYERTGLVGNSHQVAETLLPGHQYHWRVRAVNAAGPGAWSTTWYFFVTTVVGLEPISSEVPAETALAGLYPNPTRGETTVLLDVAEAGEALVRVVSLDGRVVGTLLEGPVAPGRYRLDWNAEALPSGLYLVEVRVGEARSLRRVTVVR